HAAPQGLPSLIWSATQAPGLAGRSTRATRPPSAANAAAMADPSPPAAPVMMIVVPVNRIPSPPSAFRAYPWSRRGLRSAGCVPVEAPAGMVEMPSDCLQSCQRSARRSRMPGYQNEQPHSDLTGWPSGRPPFRADHVGSLLRPPEVLRAREDFAAGRLGADRLREIEDAAIREVVRMQQEVGLRSATDGELRRESWHMDFIYQLGGIAKVQDDTIRVTFHNERRTYEWAPPSAHVVAPVT